MGRKQKEPRDKIKEVRIYLKVGIIEDLGGEERLKELINDHLLSGKPKPKQKEPKLVKEKELSEPVYTPNPNDFYIGVKNKATKGGIDYCFDPKEPNNKIGEYLAKNRSYFLNEICGGNEELLRTHFKDFWTMKTSGQTIYRDYPSLRSNLAAYLNLKIKQKPNGTTPITTPKASKLDAHLESNRGAKELLKKHFGSKPVHGNSFE